MLRAAARFLHSTPARLAKPAAEAATAGKLNELVLNFAVPYRALVAKKEVRRVTVPSRDGVLGVAKNSPPLLAELGPGVVRVDFMDNSSEEFFVPGGFAFKHANNVMDVSAPEGVKLNAIDADALRAANAATQKTLATATAGSKEQALAKAEQEVFKVRRQHGPPPPPPPPFSALQALAGQLKITL
jgi:F0F1-type ATP synthase epsilon subunit